MSPSQINILMDLEKIKKYIPHRDPLLLIDSIHEVTDNDRIVSSKTHHTTDPVFAGHFPDNPIYPGVYYIEGMAQSGAVLIGINREKEGLLEEKLGFLASIDDVRFRKPTGPGDTVRYEVSLEKTRGPFLWFKGTAFVNDEIAVECKFSIALGASRRN
ncbi:3-hydroxyacyl-ACP dehydratase FabZ [Fluviispira multicolorata]|nr:3-hydroxyacyl-ACP dehydratase FabZ [Fluviispira multicolorata]